MNQEDVIRMATEAGLCYESNGFVDWIDAGPSLHEMTLFAQLIAAAEFEAFADKLNDRSRKLRTIGGSSDVIASDLRIQAAAIRARGQQ